MIKEKDKSCLVKLRWMICPGNRLSRLLRSYQNYCDGAHVAFILKKGIEVAEKAILDGDDQAIELAYNYLRKF